MAAILNCKRLQFTARRVNGESATLKRGSILARSTVSIGLCGVLLSFFLANGAVVPSEHEISARFLSYGEASETVKLYAKSMPADSGFAGEIEWDRWVRAQDKEVRSRIDRGIEDSICNFILYGTSFTNLARVEDAEDASHSSEGSLTKAASDRVRAVTKALAHGQSNERVEFAREYLKRKGIASDQVEQYLSENLVRFAAEQREYHSKLEQANKSGDVTETMATRGTLYAQRGLSVDTSLLPNYAVEDTLRVMKKKGVLKELSIRRIAVIGPGLDFTDKRDGYDFYPLQTIQPFAVMEAVERLGLGKTSELRVTTLDLNAAVNAHVAKLSENGRQGRAYTLQLPRDTKATWSMDAVNYWEHFGEIVGNPEKPLSVPGQLAEVKLRAVAVTSERAARVTPIDLNIVAQTLDAKDGEGFDLVVATNILVYYDRFQQALAMSNIARMMNTGGIFVSNTILPAAHDERLKFLGARNIKYEKEGAYGDDIVVYARQ